jgi:hypothetical protein
MQQRNDEARMTNERINAEVRMSGYAVSASSFGFVSDFAIPAEIHESEKELHLKLPL